LLIHVFSSQAIDIGGSVTRIDQELSSQAVCWILTSGVAYALMVITPKRNAGA
jgi:hypothetical protein